MSEETHGDLDRALAAAWQALHIEPISPGRWRGQCPACLAANALVVERHGNSLAARCGLGCHAGDVAAKIRELAAHAPAVAAPDSETAADDLTPRPNTDEIIHQAAALTDVEYDQQRNALAERAEIRVTTLDKERNKARGKGSANDDSIFTEIEPWHEPVDGAALFTALTDVVRQHVILTSQQSAAVALWIMHAHAHDTASVSPLLAITSPAPECGKSTLLSVIDALVPRSLSASNVTPATIFRAVEKWQPTLLIDEADTFMRDNDELRGIINCGHSRGAAFVMRTVGDDHDPKKFSTWTPKAIALIGKLPTTLASRSIHIELQRKPRGARVTPFRADKTDHLKPLARKAARWTEDHVDALRKADPPMPDAFGNRVADNWRHLFAIADLLGNDIGAKARYAAETVTLPEAGQTVAVELLAHIRQLLGKEDRITTEKLIAGLTDTPEKRWCEFQHGKPITPRGVSRLLEPFGIRPTTIRIGGNTAKGYHLDGPLRDAFEAYLPAPPDLSVTTSQASISAPFELFLSVTDKSDVTAKNNRKPAGNNDCDGVTDKTPLLIEGTIDASGGDDE